MTLISGDEICITACEEGGGLILKVVAGDITKETSQVVVNSRGWGDDITKGLL